MVIKSPRPVVRGRIIGRVDYVYIDLGTGSLRIGCSNEGDEECREIGNYPEAQAGTPSLVRQAPSDIIYERKNEGPARAIAFGHARPRRAQIAVSRVKIALLPEPESYGYSFSLLSVASDTLGLKSVQQIPEDFLRLAIDHATRECNGPPQKGWVFSVPQSYQIQEVQNFRMLIRNAGCTGEIYIHGESDAVTFSNLPSIEDIIGKEKRLAFLKGQNFLVAAAILDLGAGTTDLTTVSISFKVDGTSPTIKELTSPLGFAIGGDVFDYRFIDVLRAKQGIDLTPDKEQALFERFLDHFRKRSKPQWSTNFEEEEYPFHIPSGATPFVLKMDDMTCIMNPVIDETCQRVANYLNGLELELVIVSGGNSEVPGMLPALAAILKEKRIVSADDQIIHSVGQSSNAVLHGLHYWTTHPQLVEGRYAKMTLSRVISRPCKELAGLGIAVPAADAEEASFYTCADRIMTEGEFIPGGICTVDIYYDIDADAETLDVDPMIICIPNTDSEQHTSPTRIWNFASECRSVGTVDLRPTLANVDIAALKIAPAKGKRRCWLRLGIEVGIDITFLVTWRHDGRRVKDNLGNCSSKLLLSNLDLPNEGFVDDFRAPIGQRASSGSQISNDTLPAHLERLRIEAFIPRSQDSPRTTIPSCSSSQIPAGTGSRKRSYSQAHREPNQASKTGLPPKYTLPSQMLAGQTDNGQPSPQITCTPPYLHTGQTAHAPSIPCFEPQLVSHVSNLTPVSLASYPQPQSTLLPAATALGFPWNHHPPQELLQLPYSHYQMPTLAQTSTAVPHSLPHRFQGTCGFVNPQHLTGGFDHYTQMCAEAAGTTSQSGTTWIDPQGMCSPMADGNYGGEQPGPRRLLGAAETILASNNRWMNRNHMPQSSIPRNPTSPSAPSLLTADLSNQLTKVERTLSNWVKKQETPPTDSAIEEKARFFWVMSGEETEYFLAHRSSWLEKFKRKYNTTTLASVLSP